ncbi:MAG: nitroreductase family deazaflavin-dependent oxidoreductase [Caldilineales bacterium]|nr:nitroreductase family deazaflavin-dependent oxidoreductase [Caldilineales bacterium]
MWWQRLVLRLAAHPTGARFLAHTAHRLDRPLLRLSRGHVSLTTLLTGLPTLLLTTTGARSGRPRTQPLLALPDGEGFILVASSFGRPQHPAWYHNLRRHPQALVTLNGRTAAYQAHELDGAERERCWQRAVAVYPGYALYAARAGGRRIPVLRLIPLSSTDEPEKHP